MLQTTQHDQSNSSPKSMLEQLQPVIEEEQLSPRATQLKNENKKVWNPWWNEYLTKCAEFMRAARKGDYNSVARLINVDFAADMAVNVNYQEPKTGYSALHYAVINKDTELANLLVKNYADVKA